MWLSDANGAVLLPTVGMGVTGQSDVMEISLPRPMKVEQSLLCPPLVG
jgi:hypothetical protein